MGGIGNIAASNQQPEVRRQNSGQQPAASSQEEDGRWEKVAEGIRREVRSQEGGEIITNYEL